jgi:hypothetical protein
MVKAYMLIHQMQFCFAIEQPAGQLHFSVILDHERHLKSKVCSFF